MILNNELQQQPGLTHILLVWDTYELPTELSGPMCRPFKYDFHALTQWEKLTFKIDFCFRAGASPMLICLQPPTMHQKDQQCKERSPWKGLQKFFSNLFKETQYRLRPNLYLTGSPHGKLDIFFYCRIHNFFSIFEILALYFISSL
jgi:hypothetical protein